MSSPYVFQQNNLTTGSGSTWLSDFSTWVATVGWTVDLATSSRMHLHKGAVHIEVSASELSAIFYPCTGYTAGQTADNQPGYTDVGANLGYMFGSAQYPGNIRVVSTPNSLVITCCSPTTNSSPSVAFGEIIDALGTWGGGAFIFSNNSNNQDFTYSGKYSRSTVWVSNAWTPRTIAGGVNSQGDVNMGLAGAMPFIYSGGILAIPRMVFQHDLVSTNLIHPIGYLPQCFCSNGGDVYADGDIVTLSGVDYYFANIYAGTQPNSPAKFMFAIGS